VRSYFEFRQSPVALLAAVLAEVGAGSGTVGIETRYLSAHYWEELEAALPAAEIRACDAVFDQARAIKTPEEIRLLARAARNTEKALLSTYTGVFEGESEFSLVERLSTNLLRSGAESVEFAYINAGPNTGYPHSKPSAYTCRAGDVLKTDCGASYEGYISDVARTAVIGPASAEQLSIYNRLLEIHHHCIGLVRPGTRACEIYEAMQREHERVGIHFGLTHAGHSVGITGHEHPILNPYDKTPLEPNMIFYVETRVRWAGKAGYHIEDLVQVTDDGPLVHTGFFDINRLLEL
jgi:Xaa-Pro aminopeptidase